MEQIETVDCVAIVSGGLDSITLLHYLVKQQAKRPAVLSFAYGQKHQKEIEFAREHVRQLELPVFQLVDLTGLVDLFGRSSLVNKEIEIPHILQAMGDPQPTTYVPNRNMIFLSLAAAFAETYGVEQIYYGAQKHDMYGYWDTTPEFLSRINQTFALNRKNQIQIEAPFVAYSKGDIVRIGLDLGIDYGRTWSCYEGGQLACGHCPTCAERLQAFVENGAVDPLAYARIG